MKTISDYTIYCTPEQTKKAFELGAPIRNFITKEESKRLVDKARLENRIEEYENELAKYHQTIIGDMVYCYPTAEQMISWLEEQGMLIDVSFIGTDKPKMQGDKIFIYHVFDLNEWKELIPFSRIYSSRKEATLASIDAALEYLSNNKK